MDLSDAKQNQDPNDISLDFLTLVATRDGVDKKLGLIPFTLLATFRFYAGQIFTREEACQAVEDYFSYDFNIDNFYTTVCYINRRFGAPKVIESRQQKGMRYVKEFWVRGFEDIDIPEDLQYKDITLKLKQRIVMRGDIRVNLAPAEFSTLAILIVYSDQILSGEELHNLVFGIMKPSKSKSNTMSVHISRMGKKLELPDLIETILGRGYQLRPSIPKEPDRSLPPGILKPR